MAMVAKKPLAYGLTDETKAKPQASDLKTAANPLNNLERNRIARNALYPTGQSTLEKAAADLTANKTMNTTPGVLGSVTGALAAVTPVTTKKTGSGGGGGSVAPTPAPTNPYAAQMQAAQNTMNQPRPTYTAPVMPNVIQPTYTNSYAGRIAEQEASAPGAYTSQYQPNIDGLLNKLENREAFNFNLSEDPLYRQLAAKHLEAGRKAMKDTMGTAAGMSSGYGNSYASTAASQAYQQHVNELNDDAIDLYSMAQARYDAEGNEMRNTLAALQSAESMNRANFESDRADYYNRLNALRQGEATERQQYLDDLNQYNINRDYNQAQEQIAWGKHMDEMGLLNADQQRAWEQYKYWNDLWEAKQAQ